MHVHSEDGTQQVLRACWQAFLWAGVTPTFDLGLRRLWTNELSVQHYSHTHALAHGQIWQNRTYGGDPNVRDCVYAGATADPEDLSQHYSYTHEAARRRTWPNQIGGGDSSITDSPTFSHFPPACATMGHEPQDYTTNHVQACLRKLHQQFYWQALDVDITQWWACISAAQLVEALSNFPMREDTPGTVHHALSGTLSGHAMSNPFMIYGDNIHWRAIAFSTRHQIIYLMDPYGMNFPDYMYAALQRFTDEWHRTSTSNAPQRGWQIHELSLDLQYRGEDRHSCGAWTIWMAQQWLKYHLQPLQTVEHFSAYLTREALKDHRPTRQAGPKLRELYHTFMTNTNVAIEPELPSTYLTARIGRSQLTIFQQRPRMTPTQIKTSLETPVIMRAREGSKMLTYPVYNPAWAYALTKDSNYVNLADSDNEEQAKDKEKVSHNVDDLKQIGPAMRTRRRAANAAKAKKQRLCKGNETNETDSEAQCVGSAAWSKKQNQQSDQMPKNDQVNTPPRRGASPNGIANQKQKNVTQRPQSMPTQQRQRQPSITQFFKKARPEESRNKRKATYAGPEENGAIDSREQGPTWNEPHPHKRSTNPAKEHTAVNQTTMELEVSESQGNAPVQDTKPFSVLTWNVMGLTTINEELKSILLEHDPDVVMLTETKLLEETHQRTWIKHAFLDQYALFCSSIPAACTKLYRHNPRKAWEQANRAGSGGVILAVHQRWANGSSIQRHVYEQSNGHIVGLDLQPPNMTPIRMIGVYMPHDMEKRRCMYQRVQEQLHDGVFTIIGGDWNAALLPGDRGTRSAEHHLLVDSHHQDFVSASRLCHLPWDHSLPHRRHTFHPHVVDQSSSRIDDILISAPLHGLATDETHIQVTNDSDHSPLLATLDLRSIGLTPPPMKPTRQRQARLKSPVSKAALQSFKDKVSIDAAQEIHTFYAAVRDTHARATSLIQGSQNAEANLEKLRMQQIDQVVLAHATALQELMLGKITQCAHHILEYTDTTTGDRGKHQSRRVNRKLKRSEQQICIMKNALQELEDAQQASTNSSIDQHARLENARNIIRDHNQHNSIQSPGPPLHDDIQYRRRVLQV